MNAWIHCAKKTEDPEKQVQAWLSLGCLIEQKADYHAAVIAYKSGLVLEPGNQFVRYFLSNNLGFSLNQIGEFQEGEHYCYEATTIDPSRANGYKNLGLSFLGQGKLREAADNFVRAVHADAADPRSLKHLEDLLRDHPEHQEEFGDRLEACRAAVGHIAEVRKQMQPKIHRGIAKWLIMSRWRLRRALGWYRQGQ